MSKIASRPAEIRLPRETLIQLYEVERLSAGAIAERIGCSKKTVLKELRRHGIGVRAQSEAQERQLLRETLIQLYEVEQLSLKAVGERLGCCASTVLKELQRHGIRVRTKSEAQQLRHNSPSNAEIKRLYEARLSQQKVAERLGRGHSTIQTRLQRLGVKPRTLSEANTIYPKRDFDGSPVHKAYLIGFRQGDLHVVLAQEGGQTILLSCTTTRPEQIELIRDLFVPYGRVWVSEPSGKRDQRSIHCLLNPSFRFLLLNQDEIEDWILQDTTTFAAYLAGYIDAEGCFRIHQGQGQFRLGTTDKRIIHQCHEQLLALGIQCPAVRLIRKAGHVAKSGIINRKDMWELAVYRKDSLLKLAALLRPYLKHAKRRRDMDEVVQNVIERNGRARQRQ